MATEIYIQPAVINWTLAAGDTWPLVFELGSEEAAVFTPTNLTGATARLQLRDAKGKLLRTVIPTITPLTGVVDASQPFSETTVPWTTAYYELEVTYPGNVRQTEVTGTIRVQGGGVTNDEQS